MPLCCYFWRRCTSNKWCRMRELPPVLYDVAVVASSSGGVEVVPKCTSYDFAPVAAPQPKASFNATVVAPFQQARSALERPARRCWSARSSRPLPSPETVAATV